MYLGRIAGLVYLGASVLFIAASALRARIFVADPVATIDNLRASETLVRVTIAAEVASFTLFLVTALLLSAVLGDGGRVAAGAMVIFAAVGTTLGIVAVLNELTLLSVATQSSAGTLAADGPRLIALLSEARRGALVLTDLTSGLWLLPMGYLAIRSAPIPAAIGVLLIAGGVAWLTRFFVEVLAPDLSGLIALLPIGSLGELLLMAWLIVKGARA